MRTTGISPKPQEQTARPTESVDIVKISRKQEMDDFIRVTDEIYCDYPQYVPDFVSDIRAMFNPQKNPGLAFSSLQPFVAYRSGRPVGRIVGIINRHANERWQTRNVRFSMIEFIDDLMVSRALLGAVAEWGREQGMTNLQGPLGITDFDKEGMLVEDFQLMGSMNTIYNPPYYPRHLEALGFMKEADWVQIRVRVPQEIPERYARIAAYCRQHLKLRVVKLTNRDITHGGYGRRIFDVLNAAYAHLFGFSAFSPEQADLFVSKYISLIDKQLIPVILDEEGEVVGAAITMGSLSHAVRKSHGKLLPTGWFHLLKALRWQRENSVEMLLIAVHPKYQGKGVNALFFDDLIPIYNKYGFEWAETGPQLEDNVRELSQWKDLKPQYVKRRRCYCKQID